MKQFRTMRNVGKAKYVVSHHDGQKTHKDGSPFFDCAIFSNKKELDRFTQQLKKEGHVEQ